MSHDAQCPALPLSGSSVSRHCRLFRLLLLVCALMMHVDNLAAQTTGPQVIQGQPQNQTVFAGGAAMFSVTAGGTQPLGYQWFKVGTPVKALLSNATTASRGLSPVDEPDSGAYF